MFRKNKQKESVNSHHAQCLPEDIHTHIRTKCFFGECLSEREGKQEEIHIYLG
jgi:hypothetical protein